ncbi:MAG: 30S ribosomal protein S4, partial [Nonlabens ulvanivorans]
AIDQSLSSNEHVYDFITFNKSSMSGTFVSVPERMQIPENIKEQLIVELYSK